MENIVVMFKNTIGKFLTRIGNTCRWIHVVLSANQSLQCMLLSKALRIGWQSCELLYANPVKTYGIVLQSMDV